MTHFSSDQAFLPITFVHVNTAKDFNLPISNINKTCLCGTCFVLTLQHDTMTLLNIKFVKKSLIKCFKRSGRKWTYVITHPYVNARFITLHPIRPYLEVHLFKATGMGNIEKCRDLMVICLHRFLLCVRFRHMIKWTHPSLHRSSRYIFTITKIPSNHTQNDSGVFSC